MREMLISSEIPEDSETTKEREGKFIEQLLDRPEGKCSPEMQEVLVGIDFGKLKAIFLEIASQYDTAGKINEETLNFLEKDRVFGTPGNAFTGGSYHFLYNIIFLAVKGLLAKFILDLSLNKL